MDHNTISKKFTHNLWIMADKLRGNMDPSEYKQVFLGLIFLKYISEKFERKYKELMAEGLGFENNIDEYTSCGIYYIPTQARWSTIVANCDSPELGACIDYAIRCITQANPDLKGILPQYFSRSELDTHRLSDIVRLFDETIDTAANSDMLSVAYEYCLMKFAEQEGRRAGEFYTPKSIVQILAQSLDIKGGRIYDPCCGSGGMLIQAAKETVRQVGNKKDISFYGQESNPTTWKMCLMNLAVHGIEANVGPYNADTFLQDIHTNLKADYVLASPPFNMSEWGAERLLGDARWQFGMPPAGNANFAWLQHMIYHLSPNGRMGVVLSNGTLTSQVSSEWGIRQKIICADLIECIVSMPGKLFYNTAIPVSIWFINRAKAPHQRHKVLFIDAGSFSSHATKELAPEQIKKISSQICAYRSHIEYQDSIIANSSSCRARQYSSRSLSSIACWMIP